MDTSSQREQRLFEAARELKDPSERRAYLDAACAGDEALREGVEALLALDTGSETFFAEGSLALHQSVLSLVEAEQPGDRIGPIDGIGAGRYKLLEKIGEGGCGTVYMAEQEQPVRRRVALKIIKLGMDTQSVVARFEAERQALALMEHPNIARIYDAGAIPIGPDRDRPYFVMELVRGVKITEYCDEQKLSTRERLELFLKVCDAVQHAHQKGIIHRDLKPSNILVTVNDGEAVPKVIDFGIAKAVQGRLTDQTLFTGFEQLLGTPAYMSPEQAMMSSVDVDTRSDIYSLGVLLYELLTGLTPFDARTLLQEGIDKLRETIREREPLRPSTRLRSMPGEELTTTAGRRRTEVPKLLQRVRGDLDWIVMKCLEKDRGRRYETANGLAVDIRRHLNNEPVVARPPSAAYRLQRLMLRNKLAFGAAAMVMLALALGLAVAMAGLFRERLANQETRRRAYAAEINAAFHALEENNLARAVELMERQRSGSEEEDLRGFEWRYLWRLCQPDDLFTFRDGARDMVISPDGKWLVGAGGDILIREWRSRALVKTIPQIGWPVGFSPDGNWMAGGSKSEVRVWKTGSWNEEQLLPDSRQPAVFSPDGRWLVTGSPGGYTVWNTGTWRREHFLPGEPAEPWMAARAVAFSPDGSLLVTAGHPDGVKSNHKFQVWDFPSLTVHTNFASFGGRLGCAIFSPDGKRLLTGTGEGELLIWDVAEGGIVERRTEHTGWVTDITLAPDGRSFATASCDGTIVLWDAATYEVLVRFRGHLDEVWSVAYSADGRTLASGSMDGMTKLWDATTRRGLREFPKGGVLCGFSADSRLLVSTEPWVWRLSDGARAAVPFQNDVDSHANPLLRCGDVHGPSYQAIYCLGDGIVEVLNLATMAHLKSWQAHTIATAAAVFSPDGRYLATSDGEGELKIWQTESGREVQRLDARGWRINSLAFSPDGRQLAANDDRQPRLGLWDVHRGARVAELLTGGEGASRLVFSPDGKLLANAERHNIAQLWDVSTRKLRATLRGHIQVVNGVDFSPDGRTLATGGDDRKVKLWNIATLQEVATLGIPGGIDSVKFSPDNRILAVSYRVEPERFVRLWEVPSMEEIAARETGTDSLVGQR